MGMTREERELSITYLEGIKEKYIEGEGYERHPLPEYYAIENAIKALEQESKWIPISEKLPKWGEGVLTINNDENYEINHIIDDERNEWFYDDDIVAWMPLPEPYESQESEK